MGEAPGPDLLEIPFGEVRAPVVVQQTLGLARAEGLATTPLASRGLSADTPPLCLPRACGHSVRAHLGRSTHASVRATSHANACIDVHKQPGSYVNMSYTSGPPTGGMHLFDTCFRVCGYRTARSMAADWVEAA